MRVRVVVALATALICVLALVNPALANRGAVFKATLTLKETIEETWNVAGCDIDGTITQIEKVETIRRYTVDAFYYTSGSLRGYVTLNGGSGAEPKLAGHGTIERLSNMGRNGNPCEQAEPDARALDCGTWSPSGKWPIRINAKHKGTFRFLGILLEWNSPGGKDGFSNCAGPEGPRNIAPLFKISARALVDRARHELKINDTEEYSYRNVDGTWTLEAKLVLRRTRRT